jgi:hypothetical protein
MEVFVYGVLGTFGVESRQRKFFCYSPGYFLRRPIESEMFFDELSEFHIFQYLSFLVFAILFTDVGFVFGCFSRVLKSEGITIIRYLSRDGRYIAMHHLGNSAKRILSLREKELEFISF